MISFPFGVHQAVSLQADTVIALAHMAQPFVSAEFVSAGNAAPLIALMTRHQIPPIHQPEAVRQLAAGLGIGYPERVDTIHAERVAASVGSRIKAVEILTKSITRELMVNGYDTEELNLLVVELKSLVNGEANSSSAGGRRKAIRILARSIFRDLLRNGYRDVMELLPQILSEVIKSLSG